jgi:hypothetical protein
LASRPLSPLSPSDFHLASLGLCALAPPVAAAAATAAQWHNRLLSLGAAPPLFVTHDLGWALSLSSRARTDDPLLRQEGGHRGERGPSAGYSALIRELVETTQPLADVLSRSRDEVRLALLAHLLLPLCRAYVRSSQDALPAQAELPLLASAYPTPAQYGREPFGPFDPVLADALQPAAAFAQFLVEQRLRLRTQLELIDIDLLRHVGAEKAGSARASLSRLSEDPSLGLPDLLSLVAAEVPDVRDIVRFSQDLLPAVLEPQRSDDRQRYPIGGHASIEKTGSLDSLLGSELVFDDTLFLHRLSDGEALYYGRERPPEEQPGPAQILIDASASMRGKRQVFARGLAWALGRRLLMRRRVTLRFFDGRLHEALPLSAGAGESSTLFTLLSFRSQRGRNYARVFRDLARELRSPRRGSSDPRSTGSRPSLYIVTHGECHVPPRLVQDVADYAELHAVFVMPSGPLRIDYLPWLSSYQIVDESALDGREERRRLALGLIDRAAASQPLSTPPAPR